MIIIRVVSAHDIAVVIHFGFIWGIALGNQTFEVFDNPILFNCVVLQSSVVSFAYLFLLVDAPYQHRK